MPMTDEEVQRIISILRQAFIDEGFDAQFVIPLEPEIDELIHGGE